MTSHYIPVGRLNIDKEILDLACPAAGYGSTPPNPEIYCPVNGYTKDPTIWVPPVEMVTPSTNQILLLCDDMEQGVISLYCLANTGQIKFELLSSDMTSLYTVNFSSTINYIFPTFRTGTYYIIRLSPVTGGTYIKQFYSNYGYSGFITNWRILKAIFNTPSMITLSNVFNGMLSFKECVFLTNMNSLTTLQYAFSHTPIEFITWPGEMNALIDIQYIFEYTTKMKVVDLSGISLSSLAALKNLIQFSEVNTFIFPQTLDVANTTLLSCLTDATKLVTMTLPTSMLGVITITNLCRNCKILEGNYTFPNMPNLATAGSVFYDTQVSRMAFTGAHDLLTSISNIIQNCNRFDELVLPTSANALTTLFNTFISTPVRKVVLPLSMTGLAAGNINASYSKITEEITTCNTWSSAIMSANISSIKLIAFNQPTFKVSQIILGTSTEKTKVTQVEIDWINSTYSSSAPQISIYGELSAAELNRIYTALPTVVGKTFKASGNPGYATSTPAIATAKGWTVN